jgi:LPS-assembly protein
LIEQGQSLRAPDIKDDDGPYTITHARIDGRSGNHLAYYDSTWHPYRHEFNTHELGLEIRSSEDKIFNARYLYKINSIEDVDPDQGKYSNGREQIDLSAAWRLTPRWSIFGRYNYELDQDVLGGKHPIEELYGLRYDSCCWSARVNYQRLQDGFLEYRTDSPSYDHMWMFVIELKGLTGIGGNRKSLEQTLEESIIGYTQKPLAAY